MEEQEHAEASADGRNLRGGWIYMYIYLHNMQSYAYHVCGHARLMFSNVSGQHLVRSRP